MKPKEIKPGQIWIDDEGIWSTKGAGVMCYVVKASEDGGATWDLMCWQDYHFGAYVRDGFDDDEIRRMKYRGHLKDINRPNFLWRFILRVFKK